MRNVLTALPESIANLDLSMVKMKIMEPAPEGKGWTQQQTDEAEKWYRRFLAVCLLRPDFPVVPNYPIDMMWHQHILDTRAYAKDCQEIFGQFIHHYPYFGLKGDAAERDNCFDETNQLYRELFGEDCLEMNTFGSTCGGGACKGQCEGHIESEVGVNCSHAGSGTGCGQGCGKKVENLLVSAGCNSAGSGTGCSQGCGRQ